MIKEVVTVVCCIFNSHLVLMVNYHFTCDFYNGDYDPNYVEVWDYEILCEYFLFDG